MEIISLVEIVIGSVVVAGVALVAVRDARRHRRDRLDIRHPQPTARDLLEILIAQRRPIRRKQLIELLWPEADPVAAGNKLSMLLSTVCNAQQAHGKAGPLTSDGNLVWLDRA